jgi:NADH-quinone oxidoreductase subunit G
LQDLTFRYGPGNTRMSFDKVTFEKPIPISPTISLDRERCILCYRCTRFSESVSEDLQLIAANRGSLSVITTFEDLPYKGAFTGNVTELCPVGALLPTQYRFEARPWEIVDVPTVCGLCPVGCNVNATVREGKVKRVLSRNHPEIDEGWICDKGRFAYTHLCAEDRLGQPLRRVRRHGLEAVSWEQALDEAERLLRAARGRIVTVLSGSETVEQAYALAKLLRVGLDSHQAMLPEEISGVLDAYRLPLSAIRDADAVVVLGDVPVVERAPVVDLWIKAARRKGARILDDADDPAVAEAERVVLVWCGPGGRGGATVAKLAEKLGLAEREGCGAFYLPETPNGRGVTDAWAACCDEDETELDSIGLLVVSGDEAAADENVRALAEQADATIVTSMFGGLAGGWADLVLPGTSYLERDGTFVNLEGRLQRLRRTVEPPCPDELEWIADLAARFDVDVAPYAAGVFAAVSERVYGGLAFGEVGERAPLRVYPEAPEQVSRQALPVAEQKARRGQIRLVAYKPLFSGAAVERVAELQFQRPQPELELSADDARRRKIATGDFVTVGSNGSTITLPARVNRRLRAGIARVAIEHANGLGGIVEIEKVADEVTA